MFAFTARKDLLIMLVSLLLLEIKQMERFLEEGTYTYNSLAIAPATKYNPGSFHRWIQFETTVPGLSPTLTPRYTDPFKHVVQLRPGDLSDPTSADTAKYVCFPPLRPDSLWSESTNINIYKCGIAQVASITIQEKKV
jgi:hypothetical protein